MDGVISLKPPAWEGGEQGQCWGCEFESGMVCKRAWRRWHRWGLVFTAVFVAAWLLLGAPCALLSCPSESNEPPNQLQDRDALRKLCASLILENTGRRHEVQGSPQLEEDSPYKIIYDWMPSSYTYTNNESITYTTHTTPEMISHIGELASRWSGPISVAVFVPHSDFCLAAARIASLRACGHPGVRERVSWHLFWPQESPPALDWNLSVDEDSVCRDTTKNIRSFRVTEGLPYPVNVGRNVAKLAALTYFVLPSDVELYPSEGLAEQFLGMVKQTEWKTKAPNPRVFVVPVFEVKTKVPANKEELIRQYFRHEAVYFHRHICAHCQRFPTLAQWINQLGVPGTMQVSSVVKREFPFHRWEPIYICTKNEPMYDERLTWEGLQDKMAQMHELCLRGYNLVILDRGFLVHSPGIKRRNTKTAKSEAWRDPFIAKNSQIYDLIIKEMHTKFGASEKCKGH